MLDEDFSEAPAHYVSKTPRQAARKKPVQFYLGLYGVVKYGRVPSTAYVGNSCKESTPHPNIRQYTDTRCQPAPACARWRGATVTYRPATGLHPPPRRDAISAIFTRKASRGVPAARSSNKARLSYGIRVRG
jgi:hypothetical protein